MPTGHLPRTACHPLSLDQIPKPFPACASSCDFSPPSGTTPAKRNQVGQTTTTRLHSLLAPPPVDSPRAPPQPFTSTSRGIPTTLLPAPPPASLSLDLLPWWPELADLYYEGCRRLDWSNSTSPPWPDQFRPRSTRFGVGG
jgi:hypothetical protein